MIRRGLIYAVVILTEFGTVSRCGWLTRFRVIVSDDYPSHDIILVTVHS